MIFTGPADYGDNSPTDIDFVAQEVIIDSNYAELTNVSDPNPNLALNYRADTPLQPIPERRGVIPYIDLDSTAVVDSESGAPLTSTLRTFFKSINEDEKLVVDCDESLWTNDEVGDEEGKEFHFKFDEDGNKIGAGTAWLKE